MKKKLNLPMFLITFDFPVLKIIFFDFLLNAIHSSLVIALKDAENIFIRTTIIR